GPYQARATDGGEELTSQSIELPADVGVRVMLVFAPKGGVPDGVARPDKQLPAGTIVVRAVDGGEPLKGLDVVLGEARAGERGVKEFRGKTDAEGEAKFTDLKPEAKTGYLVRVMRDGAPFMSKPFQLQGNLGARVTLDVRPVSHDLSALRIGPGSHFIFEVTD